MPKDSKKTSKKITQAPPPIVPFSGGSYIPFKPKQVDKKPVPIEGWVSVGEFMEAFELTPFKLTRLIFDHGLKVFDPVLGRYIDPNNPTDHRDFQFILSHRLDMQKEILSEYQLKKSDFENFKLDDLLLKLGADIMLIWPNMLKVGFANVDQLEEKLEKKAREAFSREEDRFTILTDRYLGIREIYEINSNQAKRDFMSHLFKIVIEDITRKPSGGQKLYDRWQELTSTSNRQAID